MTTQTARRVSTRGIGARSALALAALLMGAPGVRAQSASPAAPAPSTPVSYAPLGHGQPAFVWRPAAQAPRRSVAVVVAHLHDPSLAYFACGELAARGYVAVCPQVLADRQPRGYESQAVMLRAAMARARAEPGVSAVALVGHGAAAAAAAFYQNIATNGPSACQGPEKISPCDAGRLAELTPADALVLLDPDFGQAYGFLGQLDPAILSEDAPTQRDPALDMFDPRNGFDPGRNAGDYSAAFRKTFHEAQHARNARLITEARRRVTAMNARDADSFSDDMPFFVAGALSARLWQADTSLLARTKRPHKLLAADGSTPQRPLQSVALPAGNAREATSFRAALQLTTKQFLAGYALETLPDYDVTADDLIGVAWDSSSTSTVSNVAGVRAPLLVMTMTGNIYVRPAEMIWESAGAGDKELVGVEGASHALTPCTACAAPGQFGDTVKRTFDHIDGWLAARF